MTPASLPQSSRLPSLTGFDAARLFPSALDRRLNGATRPDAAAIERLSMGFSELWSDFVSASLRYSATLDAPGGCLLVFRRSRNNVRHFALTPREEFMFRRTLLGDRQKAIATRSNVAASTVANCIRSTMMKLGFRSRLEAAPLAALTSSAEFRRPNANDGFGIFAVQDGEFVFAKAARPTWSKLPHLTQTEREISTMIASGKSNLEISKSRNTTLGTVQNQVASLFRKMHVSSRLELLHALYDVDAMGR